MPDPPDAAVMPGLEDAFRPYHFMGVCKVVARLFDIVQPSHAVFGEKDYQQLLVIKAMAEHEAGRWPNLEIVQHPTLREADGLAMSSRNVYLDAEWRQRALGLHEALQVAQKLARAGQGPNDIQNQMTFQLFMRGFAVDYAAVRDAATLMPVERIDRPCRALIAARAVLPQGESVRLIDNIDLPPSAAHIPDTQMIARTG
jgi:pantoate--beta-alanine ligase